MNVLSIIVVLVFWIVVVYGQNDTEKHLVKPGEFPFVTSLGVADFHRKCLGTLLSEKWVLTTGKCGYKGEPLLIQHGAIQFQVESDKLAPASDVLPHPKFAGLVDYCINLIRLKNPIKYDQFTKPVKLIRKGMQVPEKTITQAISWSPSPEQELQLYDSTYVGRTWPQLFRVTGNLVVSPPIYGAPLLYNGYQIGVLVYNEDNNVLHYLDVSQHLDWIYSAVTFYEYQEEYSYLRNLEPNCTATPDSNDILDICCTYPFGYQSLVLCVEFS